MDGNLTKKNNLSILNLSPGGFGAEPGQVQHGSGEGSGEAEKQPVARSSRRFPEKVWEALVQSQVRLDRPEKVPEKFWCKAKSSSMGSGEGLGGFGAQPGQVQQGFREGSEKGRT